MGRELGQAGRACMGGVPAHRQLSLHCISPTRGATTRSEHGLELIKQGISLPQLKAATLTVQQGTDGGPCAWSKKPALVSHRSSKQTLPPCSCHLTPPLTLPN